MAAAEVETGGAGFVNVLINRRSKLGRRRNHKSKPMDPAEAARLADEARRAGRNPATWGLNESALTLASNADIDREPPTRYRVERIRRFDVFALFHARGELDDHALQAVRRFQGDMAILHRTQGASTVLVGACQPGPWIAEDFNLARKAAGERVADVLAGTGQHSARILVALVEQDVVNGRAPNWHYEVERVTGEPNKAARGSLVKVACANLAASYADLDQRPRRRLSRAI